MAHSKTVISFKNVHKSFGERAILKGVDLSIEKGQTTVIFGRSGGGKSTIIKHIVALLRADSGEIIVDGHNLASLDANALQTLRRSIGFLFQDGALFDSMNIFENIAFGIKEHHLLPNEKIEARVIELLHLVGLNDERILTIMPDALSGGMRKRVGLARTLALEPSIILYDEPTSGLDPVTARTISELIKSLQERLGVTSVLISHDITESFFCGDSFALLDEGKIAFKGDKLAFLQAEYPAVKSFLQTYKARS